MTGSGVRVVKLWTAILLAAAVFLCYGQTVNHEFVDFDDYEYIVENPHVRTGLSWGNVAWAFTSYHSHNWHPVTWLSHMVDVQLFGLHSGAHHLVNATLHAANAVLLFLVLTRLTGHLGPSAIVAAIFALHPLHVESVAWAAERKDVLSAFFFMLTLGVYGAYVKRGGRQLYTAMTVLFAWGLMAKQMLVSLPVILLFMDYWPLGRWTALPDSPPPMDQGPSGQREKRGKSPVTPRPKAPDTPPTMAVVGRLIGEKIPLFILAVTAAVTVYMVQGKSGVLHREPFPLTWRIENALVSYTAYLGKTFWPVDLAVFYPHPLGTIPLWQSWAAALFLLAVTGGCFVLRKRAPYLLVGWLWYLITLLPVIGLIQVGVQARADRYTYLPLIGIFLMVVWGLRDIAAWRPPLRRPLAALAAVALVVLGTATYRQAGYWQNGETLYRRATAAVPDNYWAFNNLGAVLANAGRIEEATAMFQRSLDIMPHYPGANKNMAVALYKRHRYDEALPYVERALGIQPQNPELHLIKGLILVKLGRPNEAAASLREALRIQPGYSDALAALREIEELP